MANNKNNCCLCFKKYATNFFNICVNKNIASVISKHFWFEMINEDGVNNYICGLCWSKVYEFHSFYTQVYNIHKQCYSNVQELIVKIEDTNNSNVCDDKINIPETALESTLEIKNKICEKESDYSKAKIEDEFADDNSIDVKNSEPDEVEHEKITSFVVLQSSTNSRLVFNKHLETSIKPIDKKKKDEENKQIQEYFSMECEFCPFRCDTFRNIQLHYRKEHKMRGYLRCCNRKFMKRTSLVEHIDRHLNPNKFKCDLCNKTYAHKRSLLEHQKWHLSAEKRPFKCTKCPKTYTKKFILENHYATHNVEKKFICNDCGKSYGTNKLLRVHTKNIHGGANIYICDVCAKEFRSKVVFEQHQKTVHENIVLPKLQCQVCGIWLKHKHYLRQHMVRHEESKVNHFCDICGKQALNRKSLHNHVMTVHSDKVYNCNLCEKTFKKPKSLREHMATHTGVTLYSCPYCSKRFNSSANMYSHKKKIHVKEWEELERLKATGL